MRALHLHVHVDRTLQSFLGKKTDLHMQPRPPIEHVMVKLAAYVMCACVRVCLCTSQPKPSTHRKAISKSQQRFQNDLVAHGNGMTFELQQMLMISPLVLTVPVGFPAGTNNETFAP